MKLISTGAVALFLSSAFMQANPSDSTWLFTSFRGNGDGLHLAYSHDGRTWTDFDQVFLEPTVGSRLMRDPHITQGPDGTYHMVWTTGWSDSGIGYASSHNLIDWSDQRFLAFMEGISGTRNSWAPESFYDERSGRFIIFWSSDVEGRFPDTVSPHRMNNRTYYVVTEDWETFSEPEVLFDPGFDNIDATMVSSEDRYILVIKEGDKQSIGEHGPIHAAVADSPLGPFSLLPDPLVTARAEGPTILNDGDVDLLYVDFYVEGRYGAYETTDWTDWRNVSDETSVVSGQRHGSILPISREDLDALIATVEQEPPPPALPGLNADPHIAVFGDTFYIYPTTDGTEGWLATSFRTWSSTDLVNWTNEGIILDLETDISWADVRAWAPAIAHKDGNYYYYFSAHQSVGVAVADHPTGPFVDPLGEPLVERFVYPDTQSIDPMVFIDDDGSAYLYFGQGRCWVVKLNDDMISFDEDGLKDITPPGYNEGAFVHQRNGVYYLSWSEYDTRDPRYSVAYGTSDSPLGPFTKAEENPILKGRREIQGAGHHSIVQIPDTDDWVIAYHRFRIPGGNGYNRETCLSPLHHADDNRILPVDVFEPVSPVTSQSGAGTETSENTDEMIRNPLIPQRADPHVWLHTDGYYYLTATVPEYDRIELRRARTIAGLASAEAKTIWTRHESGPMSHHIWAPEIHFIDGKWYIHFAAGRAESIWHIRMYVLENDSANPLEGTWTEKGQIETEWDSFSLDATTFEHRGTRYLAWAQNEPGIPGTKVYMAEMDTPWSIVGPQVELTAPEYDWERRGHNVNEGPAFLVRNDRVFMTYSASATDHNYCIGLLTADDDADLLDPASWMKSPEPVFSSNDETSQYGPGHNSFTTSPDGEVDYIVYHARNYKNIQGEPLQNPDRATRVQPVRWNADGTPDFGVPAPHGPLRE